MARWFTSDLHLGHAAIIDHAGRPFKGVREMDGRLIGAINDRVSYTDELWVLGDFSYRTTCEQVRAYRDRIVCRRVILVRGNHDRRWPEGEAPFERVCDYDEDLRLAGLSGARLVLFHYPLKSWNDMSRGAIHLHGHIHGGPASNEANRRVGLLRYDVGVNANDYAPVSEEQICSFFSGVETSRIHHGADGRY